jgi:hypothetical protein
LAKVDKPGNGVAELSVLQAREARALLIGAPSLVIPLQPPTAGELIKLGFDSDSQRNANARALGLAVCVKIDEKNVVFGVSRLVALEHGVRFGSTLLLSHDDQWTHDLEEAERLILEHLRSATIGFAPRPEPAARAWKKVVALLGGSDSSPELPESWKREMKLAAGLRETELDIRPSPESSRAAIVGELRTNPPDALLVWADWVAHPHIFINPFLSARPGARAELLGSATRSMTFGEHFDELVLHLREISPVSVLSENPERVNSPSAVTWELAAVRIAALEGEHFELTERARRALKANPYRDVARMLHHVEALEGLARHYFETRGELGVGITEFAMSEYKIGIALFDSKITPEIKVDGRPLSTVPHVKVDDYKDPASCGRIYFAIDKARFRIIVDHIGLHDYS